MLTDFFGIMWGAPEFLVLLPLFIIAGVFLIKNYKNTNAIVSLLVHPQHQKHIFLHFSRTKQAIKLIATLGALLFFFLALLRPQWHKKEQAIQQEGRDLLVMLDISRSMLAQDLKPSRLECMKLKLKTLLKKLQFERVGLILFSGSAFVQCPLTSDYATFLMFLDQVDVENIASGTTAIDAALSKAIETYRQYPNRKNKLALLVTDGEDFSLNLRTIQDQAKQENIKIFALGAGTERGAPIPKIDLCGKTLGHETDEKGGIVLSKLNEPLLKNMCSSLNGTYLRTTHDDSDLDTIVSHINKFEKENFGDRKMSLHEDQYPWFLGISWILFAIAWIV